MFGLTGRQILILLVLVGLLFAATQYVPAYFAAFQFNDSVRQAVKFAGTSKKTVDGLRDDVFQQAKELGIPIKFVGLGEKADDLQPFDPKQFAQALFEE